MPKHIHRRDFLKTSVAAAIAGFAGLTLKQVSAQGLKHDELVDEDALGLAARLRAR